MSIVPVVRQLRFLKNYLFIALGIFFIEIIIATKLSGYSFIRGMLGDFLVVIMLHYLILAFVDYKASKVALAVFIFACLIEVSQFFQLADYLQLRHGSVLRIVIGSTFSWNDILAYCLGCLATLALPAPSPKNS